MKTKNFLCGLVMAFVLQLGMLAGSAQTNLYLFSGSKTNITLPPGTYIITAYGAGGGRSFDYNEDGHGGLGAEMRAEFNFSDSTNVNSPAGLPDGNKGIVPGENYRHPLRPQCAVLAWVGLARRSTLTTAVLPATRYYFPSFFPFIPQTLK